MPDTADGRVGADAGHGGRTDGWGLMNAEIIGITVDCWG